MIIRLGNTLAKKIKETVAYLSDNNQCEVLLAAD